MLDHWEHVDTFLKGHSVTRRSSVLHCVPWNLVLCSELRLFQKKKERKEITAAWLTDTNVILLFVHFLDPTTNRKIFLLLSVWHTHTHTSEIQITTVLGISSSNNHTEFRSWFLSPLLFILKQWNQLHSSQSHRLLRFLIISECCHFWEKFGVALLTGTEKSICLTSFVVLFLFYLPMTILRCLSLVNTSFFGSNTFCVDFLTSPWGFLENIPEAGDTRLRLQTAKEELAV